MSKSLFIPKENKLLRDFLLKDCLVSKRLLASLKHIPDGITVNGSPRRVIDAVSKGDRVELNIPDSGKLAPNGALKVPKAFENDDIVVYDKPVGMPVHPSVNHHDDTLGNCFAAEYPNLGFRPVNRLDKDTSGLCVVAKDPHYASLLHNRVEKVYYAVVEGDIRSGGTIDLPIAREEGSIIKRTVRSDGKKAVTHYTPVTGNGNFSLLEIRLETGRTHQIRVHFSYIGHPLAGDDLYGGDNSRIGSQALHCGKAVISDPVKGAEIEVRSEIREDMKSLIK